MDKDHFSVDMLPEPQKGDSISKMEISPNGTYLVAVYKQDNGFQKIVGWKVDDLGEGEFIDQENLEDEEDPENEDLGKEDRKMTGL